ncbi:metalloprotease [Umbelopsis sp. WA50703]
MPSAAAFPMSSSENDWKLSENGQHSTFTKPLLKSDNDDRDYRLIRLSNKLEVLLIHDKDTDKSSAALDVHVGHLSDPNDLQGLAHFCEHLLFMGTEKYPKENDYNQYLAEHSGHSNAFTGMENTNYYFEVGQEWLEGALDRFAQFFISPLFSDGCTERELKAVDSEHKKNLQSDSWRIFQLEKSLSNPNHPYCHFGTGNLETLFDNPKRLGLDIRDELLKFHDKYYSANIMKLCIVGRESLDQMTTWTVEKFKDVRNKDIDAPAFEGHALTPNELMKTIFIKPVKDVRSLDMTFPFPDQHPLFRVQPGRYLSHLIGHEGPGSILSFLKKKGWANYLQVGTSHGGIGFEFFRISVDLTEEGLNNYESVMVTIFQYIHMLKERQVEKNTFDEVQSLRLWHKKDDTFWLPKANVWILFRNPLAYATPSNCVKTRLYTDLLKDSLNEYSYDAEVAGLHYNIENQLEGMLLGIGGYNDKLPVLLERVVSKMKDFVVEPERFNLVKDQLNRSYKNFSLEPPYQHALYYLSYATQDKMWTHEEKLGELDAITAQDIQEFYPTLISHLHLEALAHGNVTAGDAKNMLEIVQSTLQPKSLLPSQLASHRSILLPAGSKYVYQHKVSDNENVNSALEYFAQVGNVTEIPRRARLSLLAQIAQEPCFDQLRTKEQLGYLVFSGLRKQTGSMGLRFIIQSERDTVYLENRVEEFLTKLRQLIHDMSDEEYKSQVQSLISKKLEKDKNLGQEGGKYWAHIHSGYYEFDQVDTDVRELQTISKSSLLAFVDKYVMPSSVESRKISVHLQSQRVPKKSNHKVNIESLHTCLTSQGVTRLTIDDLKSAIEQGEEGGASAEAILRKLLIDESKEEAEIEALMAKVMGTLNTDAGVNGTLVSVDSKKTARRLSLVDGQLPAEETVQNTTSTRDHTKLPEGNVCIEDLVDFKTKMELSTAAIPFTKFEALYKVN